MTCRCQQPVHEQPRCAGRRLLASRSELFSGLYDGGQVARARHSVRMLNPLNVDEDPATRRFAQLEIE